MSSLVLYRALLRQCRRVKEQLTVRKPVDKEWGSYGYSSAGVEYQAEALDELVPGLEVKPSHYPVDAASLAQLIRAHFSLQGPRKELPPDMTPLDQGFAALRAVPQQLYLQQCSSSSEREGVQIEATSSFTRIHRIDERQPDKLHLYTYRIRVTNHRKDTVQVLGRSWQITDKDGNLSGVVHLSRDNGIVGQQPKIPPGGCFEYYSGTPVLTGGGTMKGKLLVVPCKGVEQKFEPASEEPFTVNIAPFGLMLPAHLPDG